MIVACAADREDGWLGLLRRQCARAGLGFHFKLLRPFTWASLVRWERDFAHENHAERIVNVDAWDFLLLGTARELDTALGDSPLVWHSESVCWPEPHKADAYPPSSSKWRYVNGTGPCGYGWAIDAALSDGMERFPIRGESNSIFADNDQRLFTDIYLGGFGKVDERCLLSVSMNSVERHEFKVEHKRVVLDNGSRPVFAHFNGSSRELYADSIKELL